MEQDQLNDAVRKVAIVFEKLNSLAMNIEKKKNSYKLGPWMNKNLPTVENNLAKYVANVQKIV